MDADLKARWAAALRSGKYKQTREGFLVTEDDYGNAKYCCLGVLCDILKPNGSWDEFRNAYAEELSLDACNDLDIPIEVMHDLTARNDGCNRSPQTFAEIADHIERTL